MPSCIQSVLNVVRKDLSIRMRVIVSAAGESLNYIRHVFQAKSFYAYYNIQKKEESHRPTDYLAHEHFAQ